MDVEELNVCGRNPPEPWVREATYRWGRLLMRGAFLALAVFDASPIPRTETEILFLLFHEKDGCSEASALARTLRVTRQAMTGLLDRREGAGYVERFAHPSDRRRKTVRLAKKGVALVRDVGGRALRRDARIAAAHPRNEVVQALDLVERFCSDIEKLPAAGSIK